MMQAMQSGIASIRAQQERLGVIGNNLANVNTTAFKAGRMTFADVMSQTIQGGTTPTASTSGTNPIQVGTGVKVAGIGLNEEQGSLTSTNRPTDLAIQGDGFFVVKGSAGNKFTRDGSFDLDAKGRLVHRSSFMKLQGWNAKSDGSIDTTADASDIEIPIGTTIPGRQTSTVKLSGNLNAEAASTDSWTTTVRVFDSQGSAHDVKVQFSNRTAPPGAGAPVGALASWDWSATLNGTNIGGSSSAGNSPMYFDASGAVMSGSSIGTISIPASGTTPGFDTQLNFGSISQVSMASQVTPTDQDGLPAGALQSFSLGAGGTVTALFSNGLTRDIAKIAMADFVNPGGLESAGGNVWTATGNSGQAAIGEADSGGRGSLSAGYLEGSNVDIAQEFTELIVTQRGFQANTRIVTTVDEMLQDLLGLKR